MPDGTPIIRDIAIRPQPQPDELAVTFQNQPPTIRDIAVSAPAHEDLSPAVAGAHFDSGWLF